MAPPLRVLHLPGYVDYQRAWDDQRRRHAARVSGEAEDVLLLLEHEPVFTAGRRTEPLERPLPSQRNGAEVVDVDRGGKITWHGPGQLTGYPILALPEPIDVVAHVRRMEVLLIAVCADLGLAATTVAGRSGVWVPDATDGPPRKVAAVGVRVSRGVTMHGFAINCDCDLTWFARIVPCGISDAGVTSLSAELGRDVTVGQVRALVERHAGMLSPIAPGVPASEQV